MAKLTKDLKLFSLRSFFYLSPLLLFLAFFDFLAIYSGELWPIPTAIDYQIKHPEVLFSRKVADQDLRRLKFLSIKQRKPRILVLGSSRVMQIRQEMFDSKNSFYNAGGVLHDLGDLSNLVELWPETYNPEVIILGLDFYWFGEKWEVAPGIKQDFAKTDNAYSWMAHLAASRYLIKETFKRPGLVQEIFERRSRYDQTPALGLQAIMGNGFRNDGSYQYGLYLKEVEENNVYRDREQPPIIERVKTGSGQFAFNSSFVEDRLALLKQFIDFCKSKKINLLVFAPPLSSEVFEELSANPGQVPLTLAFQTKLPDFFLKQEIPYFDYSNLKSFGLNDTYMFDGMHATETALARLLWDSFHSRLSAKADLTNVLKPNLESIINDPGTRTYSLNFGEVIE